jgi:glycosyltransferase involved in cell wall biosynthesis
MRVLLVADLYPPAPGGLEAHVRRLGQALAAAGHDVVVVASGTPAGSTMDGSVLVYRAPVSLARLPLLYQRPDRLFHPPWPDPAFRRAVERVVTDLAPDVVHAHGWCAFSAAAAARAAPHRPAVVVTLHDYGLRCPKKTLLRGGDECRQGLGLRCVTCGGAEQGAVKRSALAGALARTVPRLDAAVHRYLAVSTHVARRSGFADRVEVVPNFLDLPAGEHVPPVGSRVLFVGTGERHKGLRVFLDACARLPAGLADPVVVGAQPPAHHPSWPAVAAPAGARWPAVAAPAGARWPAVAAPAHGFDATFAGRLTGEPLWQQYRDAALVVAPSIWADPCPTVVLEAMAFGRPVVGSDAGGIPDLVEDGVSGVLVPPRDPRALAAAIGGLLADRARLAAMARAARDRARLFGTDAVVPRIVAAYERALASERTRK